MINREVNAIDCHDVQLLKINEDGTGLGLKTR